MGFSIWGKITFEKRGFDWWIITLFPIIVMFVISVYIFLVRSNILESVFLFSNQLFTYCIILSTSDLALKFNKKNEYQVWTPNLLIIFLLPFILAYSYANIETIMNTEKNVTVLFLLSVIFTYPTILLYNKNPETLKLDPSSYIDTKIQSGKEYDEKLEPKNKGTEVS